MKKSIKNNRFLLFLTVLFSVLSSALGVGVALILQQIIDITTSKDMAAFQRILWITVIYLAGFGLIYYVYSYCSKRFLRNIIESMRKKIFAGVFRQNYVDFTNKNTADYISALTNDMKLVEENYILPMMLTLQYAVAFIVTLVILLYLSPFVTLCLVASMILMFVAPALFGKALEKRQNAVSERLAVFTGKIKDMFQGYEVIQSFGIMGLIQHQFEKENHTAADVKFHADKLLVLNESVSQMLATVSEILAIFISAYLVMTGHITMGTLIAILQLCSSFVMPIVMVMENIPKLKSMKPVLNRLDTYIEYQDTAFTGIKKPSFHREITLSDVRFGYLKDQPVLQGVQAVIQKGKKYAIVGESGCGKSTLVKLLMDYYSRFEGVIAYDGVSLTELDAGQLRKMISGIHQNVYMFDTTVRDNISLFREYPNEKWEKVLRISGVDRFVAQLPEGLDSQVGENGENLSGGQRQRIAIARALIQDTPILVLDEGTSAIDMQTAYDIENKLLDVEELTVITITHKMSKELLGMYDQILFMDEGKVEETGTLCQLIEQKRKFWEFYTLKM